jgi:mRNA interferase YafQ
LERAHRGIGWHDLLLIYRKSDADTLRLARLGSHSELFG